MKKTMFDWHLLNIEIIHLKYIESFSLFYLKRASRFTKTNFIHEWRKSVKLIGMCKESLCLKFTSINCVHSSHNKKQHWQISLTLTRNLYLSSSWLVHGRKETEMPLNSAFDAYLCWFSIVEDFHSQPFVFYLTNLFCIVTNGAMKHITSEHADIL
jgi:hypothetical protein